MKADAWMPLYIADYARDTLHLTTEQHGAYMLLLMACWTRGGVLPSDAGQLAGIARLTPSAWRRMSPVILAFFRADSLGWRHKRVTEEHEKAARLSGVSRANGAKGGRPPKTQEEPSENPAGSAQVPQQGTQTKTPAWVAQPSPSPEVEKNSEDKSSDGQAVVTDFDKEAWSLGVGLVTASGVPTKSARAFFGKLLSANGLEARDLLPSIIAANINSTGDPQSYLTRCAQGVARRRAPAEAKRVGFV